MGTETKLNKIYQDAQDTIDAQRLGLIGEDETLVTAHGRDSANDLDKDHSNPKKWISTPFSGQIVILDDPGTL